MVIIYQTSVKQKYYLDSDREPFYLSTKVQRKYYSGYMKNNQTIYIWSLISINFHKQGKLWYESN